ncbi:LytTR family DNA-binding domain-containing protein [Lactobacillus sp. ESL0791]|uniref:LytTR family DNA-binding domain-containing protein n=1 Tax=Lactobacillus sp. ESL0791 TaxID=2983234 RepID=UPI0023F6B55F|nr:LytTR family DNA-binding domain-containing protein [Lactobacillus sp. ESL0791]MDF7638411.1 LytTR family DNA-binding domain-containing protein [Lactobacillus sp. ESL0791]
MHVSFEKDAKVDAHEPTIVIKAAEKSPEVEALLHYLDNYNEGRQSSIVAIKTSERILMVKTAEIIFVDIYNAALLIYTTNGIFHAKDTLANFGRKLPAEQFLQISKHAIINVDHLLALEDSFSGNLTAKLTGDFRTSVSRKYVKDLMNFLGI